MTEDEEVSYKHSLNYMYLYLFIAAFKLPLINIRAQLLNISCAGRFFFFLLFNPGRREIENLIVQCKDFNFGCYNELGLLMIHLTCLSL